MKASIISLMPIIFVILFSFNNMYAQNTVHIYDNDSITNFANPERGYHSTTNPGNPVGNVDTWELTEASWTNQLLEATVRFNRINKGITLHAIRYNISMFRSTTISQKFLDRITDDFARARRAGIKLIVRFVHGWVGQRPDASKASILLHLSQLKPVLEANKDVLNYFDAGFVGCWGEWNRTTNALLSGTYKDDINADSRAILDSMFKTVPQNRMITMRYPRQKAQYFDQNYSGSDYWMDYNKPFPMASQAYNGSDISRAGNHLDNFRFSITNDYGYNTNIINSLSARVAKENLYTVQGGEMDKGLGSTTTMIDSVSSVNELKKMHWTAFNLNDDGGSSSAEYGPTSNTLKVWQSIKPTCYNYIAKRLGYRLRLISSIIPQQVVAGEMFTLSFVIKNDGFASLFNPRKLELVLRNTQSKAEQHVELATDPRSWKSDSTYTVNAKWVIPADFVVGQYELFLNLPDPESTLYGRPEYSIRLANQNAWEATTGYNSFMHMLSVNVNTGISTNYIDNDIQIYPNPANGEMFVDYYIKENKSFKIIIYNLLGKEAQSEICKPQGLGKNHFKINTSNLKNGVYILKLNMGITDYSNKVCINR